MKRVDDKGLQTSAAAYSIRGQWRVACFGQVAVGNGRFVLGYLSECSCATQEVAEAIAAEHNLQKA
jgi:hypothetical protein